MLTIEDLKAIKALIDDSLDTKLKIELKPIKTELRKVRYDLNAAIKLFDTEHIELEKRVTCLEKHLNLP